MSEDGWQTAGGRKQRRAARAGNYGTSSAVVGAGAVGVGGTTAVGVGRGRGGGRGRGAAGGFGVGGVAGREEAGREEAFARLSDRVALGSSYLEGSGAEVVEIYRSNEFFRQVLVLRLNLYIESASVAVPAAGSEEAAVAAPPWKQLADSLSKKMRKKNIVSLTEILEREMRGMGCGSYVELAERLDAMWLVQRPTVDVLEAHASYDSAALLSFLIGLARSAVNNCIWADEAPAEKLPPAFLEAYPSAWLNTMVEKVPAGTLYHQVLKSSEQIQNHMRKVDKKDRWAYQNPYRSLLDTREDLLTFPEIWTGTTIPVLPGPGSDNANIVAVTDSLDGPSILSSTRYKYKGGYLATPSHYLNFLREFVKPREYKFWSLDFSPSRLPPTASPPREPLREFGAYALPTPNRERFPQEKEARLLLHLFPELPPLFDALKALTYFRRRMSADVPWFADQSFDVVLGALRRLSPDAARPQLLGLGPQNPPSNSDSARVPREDIYKTLYDLVKQLASSAPPQIVRAADHLAFQLALNDNVAASAEGRSLKNDELAEAARSNLVITFGHLKRAARWIAAVMRIDPTVPNGDDPLSKLASLLATRPIGETL